MDDDAYATSADMMQARIQKATDRQHELAAIFAEHEIVFGLYPDPESITRWDKYVIKGANRLDDHETTTVACLWCRRIEDAMTMAQRFGDDRNQAK